MVTQFFLLKDTVHFGDPHCIRHETPDAGWRDQKTGLLGLIGAEAYCWSGGREAGRDCVIISPHYRLISKGTRGRLVTDVRRW